LSDDNDKFDFVDYGNGPREIYRKIRDRILRGELQSGSVIKIQSLAQEFGVSIIPVREACRMLAADHLIETRPRRSPIVATIDFAEVAEINEIRLALEPLALAAAVPNHTKSTISTCRELIETDFHTTNHWEKAELNRRFHLALIQPCGKPRIIRTIAEQYDGIIRFAHYLVIYSNPDELFAHPHSEHRDILHLVEAGEDKKASALLHEHIKAGHERMKNRIKHIRI